MAFPGRRRYDLTLEPSWCLGRLERALAETAAGERAALTLALCGVWYLGGPR